MIQQALKLVSGRQFPLFGYINVSYKNLDPGIAVPIFELPAGATLTDGRLIILEAFNSTGTDTIDIGDPGYPNANPVVAANPVRYKVAANVHALGASQDLGDDGIVYPAPIMLTARWNSGGGVPTTGKFRLEVLYVVAGRAQVAQGLDK
jgi:hypothetical protein